MTYSKNWLTLLALLLTSICLQGQTTLLSPNGDFSTGTPSAGPGEMDDPGVINDWTPAQGGDGTENFRFEYRADAGPAGSGDNSAVIQDFGVTGFGVLVANNDSVLTLASLGLQTGNVYQFSHDMRYDSSQGGGSNLGGFKVDFFSGGTFVSSTGDIFPTPIGGGDTWETYTYDIAIPSGVDGVKVVLLWGSGSDVLFDNVSYDPTPLATYAPASIPNGDFEEAAGAFWDDDSDLGAFVTTFPATGGVGDSGYANIEDTDGAGFAVLVSNNNNIMTLNGLGLTPGETYQFSVDMSIVSGSNIGGMKVDFFNGFGDAGSTDDMFLPLIGTGATFETYDFEVTIPSNATAIKVVLLWGVSSEVCYDNVTFDPTPVVLPPVVQVPNKSFDDLGTDWFTDSDQGTDGGTSFAFDFPSTGGSSGGGGVNPGGHATIEDLDGNGFAVLVSDNSNIVPIADLGGSGLTPGNAYVFSMDMKLISGSNLGGLKVEFYTGLAFVDDSGDQRIAPIAPASDWQTYEYTITIPPGVDGIKVVPLWGGNSKVGYDNICVDDTPFVPPAVEFLNPDFEEPNGLGWIAFQDSTLIEFPATGGNPGGYCRMDNGGAGFGVIVSNNGAAIPIADLGLSAGTTITIEMDMLKNAGTDMGTMKVEYLSGSAGGFPTDEVVAPNPAPQAADGVWSTYVFDFAIPATIAAGGAVDGIKIVPIAGIGSDICFDNIVIVVPTPDGEIVLTVDSFDTVNNMIMLNLEGVEAGETYSIFSSSTLSGGVTNDTGVDVTDATSQPFAVPADEASSPGFFQAKQD